MKSRKHQLSGVVFSYFTEFFYQDIYRFFPGYADPSWIKSDSLLRIGSLHGISYAVRVIEGHKASLSSGANLAPAGRAIGVPFYLNYDAVHSMRLDPTAPRTHLATGMNPGIFF